MVQSSETEAGSSDGGFAISPVFVQGIPVAPPPQSTKFRLRVNQQPSSDNQNRSQRPKRQPRPRRVIEIGAGPQHLSRAQRSDRASRPPTVESMQEHLARLFIGYRPGDCSAAELPDELPQPRTPPSSNAQSMTIIDLSTMTQEQLAAEAKATGTKQEIFSGLLHDPPPILRSRVAQYTGQDSVHAQRDITNPVPTQGPHGLGDAQSAQDAAPGNGDHKKSEEDIIDTAFDDVTLQILHSHLSTGRHVSWKVLGIQKPVHVGGVELSLLKLWQKVQEMGGHSRVTAAKKWTWLAMQLGVEPSSNNKAGYNIKNIYAKYLLPYELYLQENLT